ncbi:hypothetical protein R1sor_006436 [Riccia sorocarpa]|uniref:Vomeronasal type-1 receptor n=1 Tax=Riccia sorocarpa TaxID=122646 RepID=A0ABD3HR90_9MARC
MMMKLVLLHTPGSFSLLRRDDDSVSSWSVFQLLAAAADILMIVVLRAAAVGLAPCFLFDNWAFVPCLPTFPLQEGVVLAYPRPTFLSIPFFAFCLPPYVDPATAVAYARAPEQKKGVEKENLSALSDVPAAAFANPIPTAKEMSAFPAPVARKSQTQRPAPPRKQIHPVFTFLLGPLLSEQRFGDSDSSHSFLQQRRAGEFSLVSPCSLALSLTRPPPKQPSKQVGQPASPPRQQHHLNAWLARSFLPACCDDLLDMSLAVAHHSDCDSAAATLASLHVSPPSCSPAYRALKTAQIPQHWLVEPHSL